MINLKYWCTRLSSSSSEFEVIVVQRILTASEKWQPVPPKSVIKNIREQSVEVSKKTPFQKKPKNIWQGVAGQMEVTINFVADYSL